MENLLLAINYVYVDNDGKGVSKVDLKMKQVISDTRFPRKIFKEYIHDQFFDIGKVYHEALSGLV